MILIRSLLYILFMGFSVVIYALVLIITGWILSFKTRSRIANSWGRLNTSVLKSLCKLGYRIEGWEHLPGQNCIVVCNHQSAWETIALRGLLPCEQAWILKQELMSVPFFGWALKMVEPIAIDRSAGRAAVNQVITQGKNKLAEGRWVIVFPEGTRVPYGSRKKHGIGASVLAEKTGVPILPIVHNAGRYWRRRGIKKIPGVISVIIGPPIVTVGKSSGQIRKSVEAWMDQKLSEIEKIDRSN